MMSKVIITRKEGAESMGIGLITFDSLLRRQDDPLPHIRVGRRVLIPVKEFEEWLTRQTKKAVSA